MFISVVAAAGVVIIRIMILIITPFSVILHEKTMSLRHCITKYELWKEIIIQINTMNCSLHRYRFSVLMFMIVYF